MIGSHHFYSVVEYRRTQFPFSTAVEELLGQTLELLRSDRPVVTRETDQLTAWHQAFYGAGAAEIHVMYRRFILRFVAAIFDEDFLYQRIPTFRVHEPGNKAVGDFHRDGDYGHPDGEVNFWVPLTRADGTATICIEDGGGDYRPIHAYLGDMLVFDGRNRAHGNLVNREAYTRVSFDFRCLPVSRYVETAATSVNSGLRFAPGEYYALAPARAAA